MTRKDQAQLNKLNKQIKKAAKRKQKPIESGIFFELTRKAFGPAFNTFH